MRYQADGTQMWDGWFLNVEDRVHLFHMQVPPAKGTVLPEREHQAVGHAYTDDLVHWTQCPRLLHPLYDEAPMDYHQKFTGCAAQKDGTYYVFYTMRDKAEASQRIGVTLSRDLEHFELYEHNPVLEPEGDGIIGYHNRGEHDWGIIDCRDLLVVESPGQKGFYYGYFATAADVGREHPVGVIAMATSYDLLHWENQRVVFVPEQNGAIEVPDVYYMDGKWYLTMLAGANYCGRDFAGEDFITGCTITAVADRPEGPFVRQEGMLLGGPPNSGFTCRTVEWKGKRYLFYIDRNDTGNVNNTLTLPKEIRLDPKGRPRAYYAELLQNCRLKSFDLTGQPELLPNSLAWRTFGGHVTYKGGRLTLATTPRDYQIAYWPLATDSLEWNATLSLQGTAGGFYLGGNKKYAVFFEPEAGRIRLTGLYDFELVAMRQYPFCEGKAYDFKILSSDGVAEVYINGELVLQCGIGLYHFDSAGLFCDRGTLTATNLSAYELG